MPTAAPPSPVLEIALPTPLRRLFDYLPPEGCALEALRPGMRLQLPFGRRRLTGVLLGLKPTSALGREQLRHAGMPLDAEPVLDEVLLALIRWTADYYCHPQGEAIFHALPPPLRKGRSPDARDQRVWRLTPLGLGLGEAALARAPRQRQALEYLRRHGSLTEQDLSSAALAMTALNALTERGLVCQTAERRDLPDTPACRQCAPGPQLNEEQAQAVQQIAAGLGRFATFLLEGITGSGKTEVYLRAIAKTLERGGQALVLVPEIGLTPQTIERFRGRFGGGVVAVHSGLSDGERLQAWQAARLGQAGIVIGTRSAVFTPFRKLGLIVVDEEHDSSYKQQEGFRYSARDVAVKRAQLTHIPVLLGSATPSCESLKNADSGRYHSLCLRQRAGGATSPQYQLLDLRGQSLQEGFSAELLDALDHTIARGDQALVYINRRGYAPTLMCHSCGWVAQCAQCDARTVVYKKDAALRCHLCEARYPLPQQCPQCAGRQLQSVGQGTERSEAFLQHRYAATPVLRIDRDTTRAKGSMDQFLARIQSGEPAIMVGTQMLAKGHHFPDVTLVGVIDADAGLCSADFRGPERTAQMLLQVAGRAGRASKPGQVMIQTHSPDHPILQRLIQDQYRPVSETLLEGRRQLGLPPFGHIAMIRCDGREPDAPRLLLRSLRQQLQWPEGLTLVGPLAPPVSRLAGRYRWQLLFKHPRRAALHAAIGAAVAWLAAAPSARALRWAVDVDTQDFF